MNYDFINFKSWLIEKTFAWTMTLHQLTSYNHIDKGSDKRYEHEKKVKRDAHRVRTYMKTDCKENWRYGRQISPT